MIIIPFCTLDPHWVQHRHRFLGAVFSTIWLSPKHKHLSETEIRKRLNLAFRSRINDVRAACTELVALGLLETHKRKARRWTWRRHPKNNHIPRRLASPYYTNPVPPEWYPPRGRIRGLASGAYHVYD